MYSQKTLKRILADCKKGSLSVEDAYERLKNLPYENLSFARLDHHRCMRSQIPEVVFAPHKTPKQIELQNCGKPTISKHEEIRPIDKQI